MSTEFYWLAVAAVTIISAARLTRLATWDVFPPVMWLRNKYADATDGNGWQILAFCGYCASFWITAVIVGWGLLAGVYDPVSGNQSLLDGGWGGWWWVVNSILAFSYLAAILMAHDGDDGDDD